MEFEEFVRAVEKVVKRMAGDAASISVEQTLRNNNVKDVRIGFSFKHNKIVPNVILNDEYINYCQDKVTVHEVAERIINTYKEVLISPPGTEDLFLSIRTNYQFAKNRIFCKLVNREMNKEMLSTMPYVEWNDLAVIFYCVINNNGGEMAAFDVKNDIMEAWRKSPEELYEDALRNNRNNADCVYTSLAKALNKPASDDNYMYFVNDNAHPFGAATMLYSYVYENLANKLETNLIVLPCSIHEVIVVPDVFDGYDAFKAMVKDINGTEVDQKDFLSDNVYRYNRATDEFEIV